MPRTYVALLVVIGIAAGAQAAAAEHPATRATPALGTDPVPTLQPRRFDSFDGSLPEGDGPPMYRGPWAGRMGRGGCCHETRDGQIYCHGVRS